MSVVSADQRALVRRGEAGRRAHHRSARSASWPATSRCSAILAEGEVRITTTDGQVVTAKADDGFLSMQNDIVTIVAGAAELL